MYIMVLYEYCNEFSLAGSIHSTGSYLKQDISELKFGMKAVLTPGFSNKVC